MPAAGQGVHYRGFVSGRVVCVQGRIEIEANCSLANGHPASSVLGVTGGTACSIHLLASDSSSSPATLCLA